MHPKDHGGRIECPPSHQLCLDVGDLVVVLLVLVMEAGEMAKVGGCLIQCDGTFLVLCNGSGVVIQGSEGEFTEIIEGGSHVRLGKDTHLFTITVC